MDTLFKNVWVVTVDEQMRVLENASVRVQNGRITYVGTEPQDETGARVIDGKGRKMLMPGFVNGHTHLPMVLFRSSADDLELQTWLNTRIFPMEARLTPDSVECGAELALCEMARAGVTTINDMYTQCRGLLPALEKVPLRATLSMGLFGQMDNAQAQLDDAIAFHNEADGALGGLIRVGLGPHAEYTNTEDYLRLCGETARKLGCPLHIHVSETKREHEECKQRYGVTPVRLLERADFFEGNRAFLAHCVWLEDEDFDILKKHNVSVACCPASNLKLASGYANIPKMLEKGINIALGTDGAASNNNLNILQDIYLFGVVYKGFYHDSTLLTPAQVLHTATRAGALSQGRTDCGKLAVGYKADLCVIDTDTPQFTPMTDAACNVVYAAQGADVRLTMVDGEVLYRDGEFKTIDIEKVKAETQKRTDAILRRL